MRLVDGFGRVATDLRVSLTDRCNLRCTYCMPAEGLPWLPNDTLLTDDELIRVVRVAVDLGVTDIRFTGGEPLLRPSLPRIVRDIASHPSAPRISLTTNGIGLASVAHDLKDAGLHRVNVSLDTLDADRFKELTRRPRIADVFRGLEAAAAAGLTPVKVNAVLMRGVNDVEAVDLLTFCLERGYELRFIEQMPLDAQHAWSREEMIAADEILDLLAVTYDLTADEVPRGSQPAERFRVASKSGDHLGTVGVIGSVTRPFCAACDRVRITADGAVRNCLFARDEHPLRDVVRSGGTDDDIAAVFLGAMAVKKAGHGIGDVDFVQPDRPMSAIGG
jgi:cyclic pyranopterin phosphate synthase